MKIAAVALVLLAASVWGEPAQRPVLDTTKSRHSQLRGVPISAVTVGEGFWSARRRVNVEVSLPSLLALFEEKGIIDNFRRVSGRKRVPRRGPRYTDSDVYKWLEAVAFALQSGDLPDLRRKAEAVIDEIVAAQEPDGYLNTYYTLENRAQRHKDMRHGHEMYCLGHLLQAGIAWRRATGDSRLLEAGVRMVEYVLREFGPGRAPLFDGHPEIELALVELYREKNDRRFLDLAAYFLEGDPRNHPLIPAHEFAYLFTGKSILERTRLEGHAVRAMYAVSGATDYFLETGDARYWKVVEALWQDLVRHKLYITGGVGARAVGEAFGEPYELPNQQAYSESCAALGSMFWAWRLMHASPDSRFMDAFERALYNGANSGLSLSGDLYCYRNPLEHVGNPEDRIRNPWYDTTCCPPNLQRMLASLPGYFYSTSKEGLWVHLFDNNRLQWRLEGGQPIVLSMRTRYPWEGRVELGFEEAPGSEFTVFIRKPAWAEKALVEIAGKRETPPLRNGYWAIRRAWKTGDRVIVDFQIRERLTEANPRIRENIGKVAVERGPLVYCMEELDQPGGVSLFDWFLDRRTKTGFRAEWRPGFLGGVVVLRHPALRLPRPASSLPLYSSTRLAEPAEPGEITLIPYYAFHNRGVAAMQVWIPYR